MNELRIGFFLASRQIRRASIWATGLTVFIMTLTFLNLVFVTGILVGLPEGASLAYKKQYSSDIIITPLPQKDVIERSQDILKIARSLPQVKAISARYLEPATLQNDYQTPVKKNEKADIVSTTIVGIDLQAEQDLTTLQDQLIEGEYLNENEENYILVGSSILNEYARGFTSLSQTLENVKVGTRLQLTIGDIRKEVTVKGIVKSKLQEVDLRVYLPQKELQKLVSRNDFNYDEIAIAVSPPEKAESVKNAILNSGADRWAEVQTSKESQGQFLDDITNTFSLLGNIIGSIGLIVASITIFIVIFINAITRRKEIGILKAIGISKRTIQYSYAFQALFYAFIGSAFGILFLYTMLKPYFDANPIDFPFSDGLLVVTTSGVIIRIVLLTFTTIIAAYIPARMVVRSNTLDAILGR